MLLSDVLACHVIDHHGDDLGQVRDVRLVMDGPLHGTLASLRLDAIIVGGNALAGRLGYLRGGVRGPWPLSPIMRRLERHARTIDASAISDWDLEHHRLALATPTQANERSDN
jgi:hypothetical protein